ncbi:MAG: hypothetical protein JWR63_2019 [Conexibacter sp.]|nr:hypothetical protein [Conexibacter sp.]
MPGVGGRLSVSVYCPGATKVKLQLAGGGARTKWLKAKRFVSPESGLPSWGVVLVAGPDDPLTPLVAAAPKRLTIIVSSCAGRCRRTVLECRGRKGCSVRRGETARRP